MSMGLRIHCYTTFSLYKCMKVCFALMGVSRAPSRWELDSAKAALSPILNAASGLRESSSFLSSYSSVISVGAIMP